MIFAYYVANMNSLVKVIDQNSKTELFSCSMDNIHSAYLYAKEMENLGLEVKIVSPTITQTLADGLGVSEKFKAEYQKSVEQEINDHDGSCCVTDPHSI